MIQIYWSIPGCQNVPKILQLNCKLGMDKYKIKLLLLLFLSIHHFTVVGLVAWPLNESEAGVDLVLIETSLPFLCKFLLVSMRTASSTRKAGRILSKHGQLQPHFHLRARQLSTSLLCSRY